MPATAATGPGHGHCGPLSLRAELQSRAPGPQPQQEAALGACGTGKEPHSACGKDVEGESAREQGPGQALALFKELAFLSGVDLFASILIF